MNPAALVHLEPEMLRRYARDHAAAGPRAAPAERRWAGMACIALLLLVPLLITLAAAPA